MKLKRPNLGELLFFIFGVAILAFFVVTQVEYAQFNPSPCTRFCAREVGASRVLRDEQVGKRIACECERDW